MLIGSISLFLAAILFFVGILPSLAMAQQQQQQTTTATTTPPPSSSLSITTTPPLTPQEQEQQNRLQNVIAATTRNLNETEKQVSGVVFTPRWSEPVWVNANSIAVLIAYCLPGEFAESGQEILGGFELEVLESYAIDLPQGFMTWMAVVGNEDGNVRLPAALGVICASDLNNTDTRILSPEEQQEINNINQQFSIIQNTQITNIDQVINIINNVTTPQNGTGGTITEQPLRAEIIANATEAYVTEYYLNELQFFTSAYIKFDSEVTGGTEPYNYRWRAVGVKLESEFRNATGFVKELPRPATFTFILTVTDSKGQRANDVIDINVIGRPPTNGTEPTTTEEQPLRAEIITNATEIHRENGLLQVRAYTGTTIKFDASITGGTPPYGYYWMTQPDQEMIDIDKSITLGFFEPGTFTYLLGVSDSSGKTQSDRVQITIEERPGGVLLPPETGGEGQPPGGGLLPGIAPGEEQQQEQPQAPQPTVPEEGGEEEDSAVTPPSDDTGGEEGGGGTPPSTTEEEEQPAPGDDTGGG
ncbi:MAG TPA: hypothetical protein VFR94_03785 [Nitrososphaeraceae archaeon]|nr:hypothetical protein [Nitrososphaeraceae archaeon]